MASFCGNTNRWKIPPFSMSSGNDVFLQFSNFGNFLVEILICGKIPPFSMSSGNDVFLQILNFGNFLVEILIHGKIPPFSMSSGNGGFSQILIFRNFLKGTLIRGKFRRLVCLVEMKYFCRFRILGAFWWKH